jgi:hypothetical protein
MFERVQHHEESHTRIADAAYPVDAEMGAHGFEVAYLVAMASRFGSWIASSNGHPVILDWP